mmetsp:Transcript_18608/g.39024  ORF Transcript_18608/g.39024 Transcript_18608/m.39024 type:complete len:303 (+) Transcript_18608:84-992(+)
MSFQDVGRGGPGGRGKPKPKRQAPSSGGAFSSAYSAGTGSGGSRNAIGGAGRGAAVAAVANSDGGISSERAAGGYEQVSDGIVQYQRNVALLEKMARNFGTKNDTSVLKTQYNLQLEVIQQLGQRIESQLKTLESRLTTLPRLEASQSRTTHVKLSRDYRLVEQRFKNVQLDVKKRVSLAEAKERERRLGSADGRDGGGFGGLTGNKESEQEEYRLRQIQMQEDRINEEIMKEREQEIQHIHKSMYQVNEIYKDLAHLVDTQQEGIDQVETQMEGAKENTKEGLKHIEKANESQKEGQCVIS